MNFKLSDATKNLLANKTYKRKTKLDVNSEKFYQQHPDLAPRNVYIATGRLINKETIDKYLDNICKKSLFEKVCDFVKSIRRKI